MNAEQNGEIGGAVKSAVEYESKWNSWPNASVSQRIWMEFSGPGFDSHADQFSIATSKRRLLMNILYV